MSIPIDEITAGRVVRWKVPNEGVFKGRVVEVHQEDVSLNLGGRQVSRRGSPQNPALVVDTDDGAQYIVLASETIDDRTPGGG